MNEIKLVLPKHMEDIWERLLELQERAANGDRGAQKILDYGKNYGGGLSKMSKKP